ncbi:MAG: hypothetical protein D6690_08180 [Nitrospirae bacterium]|nr:MAG: hypothetical protein D6690_08180 [Nitrospirota bacterium]
MIRYFNGRILGEDLLNKTVDDPPRHTWGNKKYYENFIRPTGDSPLRLKEVLEDLDEHDIDNLQKYRFADDEKDELFKTY